jgi:hypothetical protein
MLTIYRVETATGAGPYRDNKCHEWGDSGGYRDNRPTPYGDTPTLYPKYDVDFYGFHSYAQFAAWFGDADLALMHRVGLDISVYRVENEHVSMARHQCIFNRALAHKTDTIDIVDFFERGCGLPEVEPDDQSYVRGLTVSAVALFAAQRATQNRLAI